MFENRFTRRNLLKALGGTAAASLLAACQPKIVEVEKIVKETVMVEKEVVKEVEKAAAEVPEIRFLTRVGALGMFMKEYARLYVEQNPNKVQIKIEEGNWEDISTKLMTAAVAGTCADIFWQPYFYVPYHIANGVMADLTDAADASALDQSIWYPWALECEKLDGRLYGIPLGVMPGWNECLVNLDILEEAGVELQPWPNMQTWEEHVQDLITIKEKTGKWGCCMKNWIWGQEMIHRNFDGRFIKYMGKESGWLDDNTQEAAKLCYDMSMTYKVEPTSAQMEGDKNKMFLAGRLAMIYDCAADIVCGWAEQIAGKFRYAYTSIPQGTKGLWGTGTWADSVNVYINTKHPDICYEVCASVGSVEASKWTCLATGMTPGACPAAWTDPDVAAKYPLYGWEGQWFTGNEPEGAAMPYNLRFNEIAALFGAEWFPCKNGEREYNRTELEKMDAKFAALLAEPRPGE